MWRKRRRRHNKKNKKYYSISNKLRKENKVSDQFEVMLSSLTLEEIIGLKLELSAKAVNNNLFGLKLWHKIPIITKDALLKYVYNSSRSNLEAASFLGISKDVLEKNYKRFNIKEYFN